MRRVDRGGPGESAPPARIQEEALSTSTLRSSPAHLCPPCSPSISSISSIICTMGKSSGMKEEKLIPSRASGLNHRCPAPRAAWHAQPCPEPLPHDVWPCPEPLTHFLAMSAASSAGPQDLLTGRCTLSGPCPHPAPGEARKAWDHGPGNMQPGWRIEEGVLMRGGRSAHGGHEDEGSITP